MKQTSFASPEYSGKKRKKGKTWREKFLGDMQQVVPWLAFVALIEPQYPSSSLVRPAHWRTPHGADVLSAVKVQPKR